MIMAWASLILTGLIVSVSAHTTHVCVMTTPGGGADTCGRFVLWLATYDHGSHQNTPGKAEIQIGNQAFTTRFGAAAAAGGLCNAPTIPRFSNFLQVRNAITSSTFRSTCPVVVQPHINANSTVKCFNSTTIGDDRFPYQIMRDEDASYCGANLNPPHWYPIVLAADSSSDLKLSVDGVDAKLSPDGTGACRAMTTQNLQPNQLSAQYIVIPASVLDVPSCGEACPTAAPLPANAASITNCPAGSPSGRVCSITCQPGYELIGGTTRCDNGNYVVRSQCTDATTCSLADAKNAVHRLNSVTGPGCGTDTAENNTCLFNCDIGYYSTGTITCNATTNLWDLSSNAACHQGTGNGQGDPDEGTDPCEGGQNTEATQALSGNLMNGPNAYIITVNGSNFDPQADFLTIIPRDECQNPVCGQAGAAVANAFIPCNFAGSNNATLVCGDGINTGLPYAETNDELGKVCYCDGSARGGCASLGDFNIDVAVVTGLVTNGIVSTAAPSTSEPTPEPTSPPTWIGTLECIDDVRNGYVGLVNHQDSCDDIAAALTDMMNPCHNNNNTQGRWFCVPLTNRPPAGTQQISFAGLKASSPANTTAECVTLASSLNRAAHEHAFTSNVFDSTCSLGRYLQTINSTTCPLFVQALMEAIDSYRAGRFTDCEVTTMTTTATTTQTTTNTLAPTTVPTSSPAPPTRGPGTLTCYAVGDPHHKTFDDLYYDWMGRCDYQLVSDCRVNGTIFSVHNRNDNPAIPVTWIEAIAIRLPSGDVIEIDPNYGDQIRYAGNTTGQTMIWPSSDESGNQDPWFAMIHGGSKSVRVPSLGVEVLWSGYHYAQVLLEPTSVLIGATCGLCGNANMDSTDDSTLIANHSHWKAGGGEVGEVFFRADPADGVNCVDPDVMPPCVCNDEGAADFCAYLRPGGEFSDCPGYDTAAYDACLCDYCYDQDSARTVLQAFDEFCRPLVDVLDTLAPTPGPTLSPTAPTVSPTSSEPSVSPSSSQPSFSPTSSVPSSSPTSSYPSLAPTPGPTLSPTAPTPSPSESPSIMPTVSTTATSTMTTTPFAGFVECRAYNGWWFLAVDEANPCEAQVIKLQEVAQTCNDAMGTDDSVLPLSCTPTGLGFSFLQASNPDDAQLCASTVAPLNVAVSEFSRIANGGLSNDIFICEADNVINHAYDGSDSTDCINTAELVNNMILSYGQGVFSECELTTVTTTQTTTMTTTPTTFNPTHSPSVSPTVDPCSRFRCSRDCEGFIIQANQRFYCGWNTITNICKTGIAATQDTVSALLETTPGDCSQYTEAPSMSPSSSAPTTSLPTALPSSMPSFSPSTDPTGAPTGDPCGIALCSMDCIFNLTGSDLGCGWDSIESRCRTGFVTTFAEANGFFETISGGCSHHTSSPSQLPTVSSPTSQPSVIPTISPSALPTISNPTKSPTFIPTASPTIPPSMSPSVSPTISPTYVIDLLDPEVHQQDLQPDEVGSYCFSAAENNFLQIGTLLNLSGTFSLKFEVQIAANSVGSIFAKSELSSNTDILNIEVMNPGIRIHYTTQNGQFSVHSPAVTVNDNSIHAVRVSVMYKRLTLEVDDTSFEFELLDVISDSANTSSIGKELNGCVSLAELEVGYTWESPSITMSSSVRSTTGTPLVCHRRCGTIENGGGTCIGPDILNCTSCNRGMYFFANTCNTRMYCERRVVPSGLLTGTACRCLNPHCHKCTIEHRADSAEPTEVCRVCRDGWYLNANGTCTEDCDSDKTKSGANLFARRCLEPFTCRSNGIMNFSVPYGCKCPNSENTRMDSNCHTCDFNANEFGQRCTKCRNRMYLEGDTCHNNCNHVQDLIEYRHGNYGSKCMQPFTCSNRIHTTTGEACKCEPRDCNTCRWGHDGVTCLD